MQKRQTEHSGFFFIVGIAAALLIIIGAGVWYYQSVRQKPVTPPPADPPVSRQKPQALPEQASGKAPSQTPGQPDVSVSDEAKADVTEPFTYDKKNEVFNEVMERRKAEFGLENSVDMVVKPDESVLVGDETVSMEEILEKIRIKEGRMVEQDLMPLNTKAGASSRKDRLFTQLKKAEKRVEELNNILGGTESADNPASLADALKEWEKVEKVIQQFDEYRETVKMLDQYEAVHAARYPHEELAALLQKLEQEKGGVRKALSESLAEISGKPPEAITDEQLPLELKRVEERLEAVRKQLAEAAGQDQKEQIQSLLVEQKRLKKALALFHEYQRRSEEIESLARLKKLPSDEVKAQVRKMADILSIWQRDREDALAAQLLKGEKRSLYGIYLVQPGDNIWNIHFRFLKEYFSSRDILLSPLSDEPDEEGTSSGVGKILKFSENMVYIYNLKDKLLTDNLNLLHPLSKIVVFNLGSALEVLQEIELSRIKEIRFDGETIWLPAK